MKRISILALVTISSFLQTGCLKKSNVTETSFPVVNQPAALEEPKVNVPADVSLDSVEPATSSTALPATLPGTLPADAIALDAVPDLSPLPEGTTVPVQLDMVSFTVSTKDGEPLNVRSRNSAEAAIVGTLAQGSSVQLLETDPGGTWGRIRSAAGTDGWVAVAHLVNSQNGFRTTDRLPTDAVVAPENPALPDPDSEISVPVPVDAAVTPADPNSESDDYSSPFRINTRDGESLNVLADPGITASVFATLPDGALVYQVEVVNSVWSQVATPNGDVTGYVATDFLELIE